MRSASLSSRRQPFSRSSSGQAEAAGADEHQVSRAVRAQPGQMPCDDPAEREAHHIDRLVAGKNLVEPGCERLGEALRIVGVRRQGGVAVAGHVGDGDAARLREKLDVADPVRPRAVAAVQEHERRARAEAAPHEAAVAAGRLDPRRPTLDGGDDGGRRLARPRFVHQYDRGIPSTCWAT
jgi:hypothetical protein